MNFKTAGIQICINLVEIIPGSASNVIRSLTTSGCWTGLTHGGCWRRAAIHRLRANAAHVVMLINKPEKAGLV